jgi:Fur family transcriptional regulator, ferric uptake regulator
MPTNIDPINELLVAHGLRRTYASKLVLGWFLAHPDTSYTHSQLLSELDKVTLYRLVDRLTQVGLLLCRVDVNRVRRFQAMPASVHAIPHFECQSCHRDSPLADALKANANDLERATQGALEALRALGYHGYSMDFAVRGVCADCATGVNH